MADPLMSDSPPSCRGVRIYTVHMALLYTGALEAAYVSERTLPHMANEAGANQWYCYTSEATKFRVLHRSLDLAARYHLTLNMFYHPILVHQHPTCRAAIQEALRYLAETEIMATHVGNDGLWRSWSAQI